MHIFDRFWGFLMQKGTNWSILNLNSRRLVHLKVHVINQKKSCTDGGNPTKKINLRFKTLACTPVSQLSTEIQSICTNTAFRHGCTKMYPRFIYKSGFFSCKKKVEKKKGFGFCYSYTHINNIFIQVWNMSLNFELVDLH